jgi:dipeptidyl aminopeptidase/acylaminoacyl peptidase
MLSTKGGDNVRAYVWDRETGAISRIAENGVATSVLQPSRSASGLPTLLAWLDNRTLLLPLLSTPAKPQAFVGPVESLQVAALRTADAQAGETTATVLESGVDSSSIAAPIVDITAVDVVSGTQQRLAHGQVRAASVSPDHRQVVLAVQDSGQQTTGRLAQLSSSYSAKVGVVTIGTAMRWLSGIRLEFDGYVSTTDFVRWGPDSTSLLVVSADTAFTHRPGMWRVDLRADIVTEVQLDGARTVDALWTGHDRLLVRVIDSLDVESRRPSRSGWWVFEGQLPPRMMWPASAQPPAVLFAGSHSDFAVGVASGALWRLDLERGGRSRLLGDSATVVSEVVWPQSPAAVAESSVVVAAVAGPTRGLYDVRTEGPVTVQMLFQSAGGPMPWLAAAIPARDQAVFALTDTVGTRVWVQGTHRERRDILALNAHLSRVAPLRFRYISYRNTNGELLQALVVLPTGYQDGRMYPAVCAVYGGVIRRGSVDGHTATLARVAGDAEPTNFNLLAAHGYVVVYPSIPLSPEGSKSDPYWEIGKSVLPALDELVRLRIVDSTRIGVIGNSFGGANVVSLITLTRRFRAAVATSAVGTDLISLYGSLNAVPPYDDDMLENASTLFGVRWLEAGQGRMGMQLLEDPDRYIRNSPVFYLDRVRTPLLMIDGDQDLAPTQSDEVFTNLYRLGRRVALVRYWGEGHTFDSPANIVDEWRRILSWFDKYLAGSPSDGSRTVSAPRNN